MDSTNKDLSHSLFHCSFSPICQDRICSECGDRSNFGGIVTGIDIMPMLLNTKRNNGAVTTTEVT